MQPDPISTTQQPRKFSDQVGSKVVHEDDQIKVWELVLEPGESSPIHTHDLPYTFYVLNGSVLEVTDQDGLLLTTITISAGEALSFDLDKETNELVDQTGRYRINRTHAARNIGTSTFREILIEKKIMKCS